MNKNFTITNSVEVSGSEHGIYGNSHYVKVDFEGKSYNVIFKTDFYDHRKIKASLKDGASLDYAISNSFVGDGYICTETHDENRMTYEVHIKLVSELLDLLQELIWEDRDALFYQYENYQA